MCRKNGETVDVYAFLTTTPNQLVATINHERIDLKDGPAERCSSVARWTWSRRGITLFDTVVYSRMSHGIPSISRTFDPRR